MINKNYLNHHSNRKLAKIVIYTGGKTPEEVASEIAKIVKKERELGRNSKYMDTISF